MLQSNIIPFSRKLASGASNGSTSSSPFFETQNSSPFGTAVASNGSTSSSQFFATQNSSPFGTTVGNSNGASGASCGCTSASPFFATQNSNSFGITAAGNSNGASGASNGPTFGSVPFPTRNSNLFGTAVGNSNGAFGASNGSTSAVGISSNVSTFASPSSATQSSNAFVSGADISNGFFSASYTPAYAVVPNRSVNSFGFGAAPSTTSAFRERSPSSTGFGFGCPTGTNTSPFVQSSSSFPGFGGAAKTSSSFGQTSSSFGGFGEAATSTTPLCGDTSSAFSTFRGEPLFRVQQLSSSSRCGAGGGPAIIDNTREGTRCAPYRPSPAEENNLSSNNASLVLTSISAMNCYCNKSHEELRSEDYKQKRNGGPSSVPNPFSVSSTNPFQPANSSGWFPPPPSEPLSFAFIRSSENPSQKTGGKPAIADNSCAGILKNLSWNIPSPVHTSISAMNCYCNKSHEELRSEDYKQIRNGGPSSAANVSGVSNAFQPANSSGWFPPSVPPPFTFNRSSENPIQRTDPSSSPGSDKNRTTPVHTSPVQTSVAQTLPSPTPTTTLSITASGGVPFIPSFVNCIIPALGASGSNEVLGFPVLIPTTLAFVPQYPQVSNPTSALPLLQWESHSNPRIIPETTNPANAHLSTIAETTSHVSLSAGVLGEQITNLSISAPPAPTNTAPSGSASPSSIPKGLEIIVEHLGFNPWEGKSHLQDSQDGQILLCEDASNDADILSLAEFAVEQHNAMEQDGKVELLKVTAACLEAVDGGRYHIVLEAKKAASSGIRVYAVVLLKKTNRPTPLIVLQRWLHCLPSYSSDCSREMVPFRARLI
ncbi:uncharacterized protein LOC141652508 isoform X1 [Silene latifolia]|uniref:uncharacterized protein LOC141652508 isoform X1 n=1 Tax=Silene latifolia TaxID=37657 RepID=UPI003D76EFCD